MHSTTKDISSQSHPASAAVSEPRVLIAAGGTGGHVYPAIAIANAVKEECPDATILFVGTRDHMEWRVVPDAGYDIVSIWISGLHRRFTFKNLVFPVKLVVSLMQSYSIIGQFDPEVVVSCGGYVAGPVGWIAAKRGIPLVIQEQNSFPGVTNRMLAKHAEVIFTAFRDADQYLPKDKTVLAGNPTRKELAGADHAQACHEYDFDPSKPVLLILGGSGGARSINDAVVHNLVDLHDEMELQIIWQCGKKYYDELRARIDKQPFVNLRLKDFIHNMKQAYAAADLIVSRAGALSCAEIALTGTPSILVPSPNVAGDHQTRNAESMAEEGASILVSDDQLRQQLSEVVKSLIHDRDRLDSMSHAAKQLAKPDASKRIAEEIIELVKVQQKG